MGTKIVKDLPFESEFHNLIGPVIPRCCTECDTAKFHYAFRCVGFGIFLDCEAWDKCPLRNKTLEKQEVANG